MENARNRRELAIWLRDTELQLEYMKQKASREQIQSMMDDILNRFQTIIAGMEAGMQFGVHFHADEGGSDAFELFSALITQDDELGETMAEDIGALIDWTDKLAGRIDETDEQYDLVMDQLLDIRENVRITQRALLDEHIWGTPTSRDRVIAMLHFIRDTIERWYRYWAGY